jgi:hypothetical protein
MILTTCNVTRHITDYRNHETLAKVPTTAIPWNLSYAAVHSLYL